MKTLLKLIIVLTAFGFATANAALTADQKAAIKAVTVAVATGNEATIKAAVNQQIALYPKIAAEIVTAALSVSNVSDKNKKLIVRVAAFTAPDKLATIINAITGISTITGGFKTILNDLATNAARNGDTILKAANGRSTNPKTNKSLVSFN